MKIKENLKLVGAFGAGLVTGAIGATVYNKFFTGNKAQQLDQPVEEKKKKEDGERGKRSVKI